MRNAVPGLIVGLIFGAGVVVFASCNPGRVPAFVVVAGGWDPRLMLVMGAGLVPSAIAYLIRRRMARPRFGETFSIPEGRSLDRPLLIGAAMFGIGWGLGGFCPGPAIAGLVLGAWQPWLFVAAMLAGMLLHRIFSQTRAAAPAMEG